MKVPAALLAFALASTVAAQGSPELPKCAQSCADKFLRGGIGNCGSDPACICRNKDFLGSIACCLVGVCEPAAQTQAVGFAASLCKGFSVTDLPTAVACSTATDAPAATTTSGSAAAATTTSGAASSSAASSSGASPAASSGGSSSGTAAAASTGATGQSTNFGPRPTAAVGMGVLGGVVAAAAVLL